MTRAGGARGRIGIFGGSFDPIHLGHLILAQEAATQLRLGRVLFVPTAVPPHKPSAVLTPISDRLRMVRLATQEWPLAEVVEHEVQGRVSYTVDTLRWCREAYAGWPDRFLIIGGDSLAEFGTWVAPDEIRSLATLAVYARPGWVVPEDAPPHTLISGPALEISATTIRSRVRDGRPIRWWVPDAVARYIAEAGLYGAPVRRGRPGS